MVISVNDARHPDDIPSLAPDWWNYGGLTRDVMLVEVPQTFIEDYSVQLERGSTGRIAGWVHIGGTAAQNHDAQNGAPQKATAHRVTLHIPELNLSQEATTDAEGTAHFALNAAKLQLWSPENPFTARRTDERGHAHPGARRCDGRGGGIDPGNPGRSHFPGRQQAGDRPSSDSLSDS